MPLFSATSSSAAVLAAATVSVAGPDMALRLTMAIGLVMITGLMFMLAGLFKLGSVTSFIAKPVLRGFAFGLAVTIILKQVASIVHVNPAHSDLIRFVPRIAQSGCRAGTGPESRWRSSPWCCSRYSAATGACRVACWVVMLGVAAGKWLDLPGYGVNLIGVIDLQLAVPSLPRLAFSEWFEAGGTGFAHGDDSLRRVLRFHQRLCPQAR